MAVLDKSGELKPIDQGEWVGTKVEENGKFYLQNTRHLKFDLVNELWLDYLSDKDNPRMSQELFRQVR
jgi:hypothetical protein